MKIACVFFLLNLQQVYADVLCGYWISSKGYGLPHFTERIVLNDATIFYHDSSLKSKMPCPDWLNSTAGKDEWISIHDWSDYNKYVFNLGLQSATKQFNQSGSMTDQNIYQASGCCFLYPNGTSTAVVSHAFNGKDFASFDIKTKTFVAAVPQAVLYKRDREKDEYSISKVELFYTKSCVERLKILKQAPDVQIRKVPEVRILEQRQAGSVTVTCHVTGFYPREVQVFWLGSDLQPVDEGVTEVLPNDDRTYQTRKSVIVPEEDVGKQNYSCVVLHISVPNNITTVWDGDGVGGGVCWWWIPILGILLLAAAVAGVWRWCSRTRGHDGHAPVPGAQHPNVSEHPLLQEQPPPTSPSPISDEAAQNTAASDEVL
uniref:Class I histocompatibility antigen, F10 alpha chain-like n=1 Tax=Astyanax mexicanus TaxID=7994 RepID=A0A3B1JZS7_ASTMX